MLLPAARAVEDSNHSFSASTWIPVAVAIAVLVGLTLVVCSRKSLRTRLVNMGQGVAVASGMPITREITAEQLAGTINRAPDAAPRRTRRPRRTPSQISTVSLPAYMKEPGEQELVVTRGPDGEDVVMPAASAVEDEDDDGDSSEGHEGTGEHQTAEQRNSRYEPMPHTPTDSPLLGQDDPRGEAPAYYEVVEPPTESYPPPGISVDLQEAESQAPAPQRRSGFFSLFRPAPPPVPVTPPAQDPSRLSLHHSRTRSTTNTSTAGTRHRPTGSTSTLFSQLSRTRSNTSLAPNNLTSPSLISLASISSPLPHTLIKTEFSALPKNGLTPEQLSLISGTKEGGLSRFGVPWGAAAVAYASASANGSRIAVNESEAPPPGWEEVTGAPGEASGSNSDAVEASGSQVPETEAAVAADTETTSPAVVAEPATPALVPPRAESRASAMSTQSFATADEGNSDSESDTDIPHIHVQGPTDATIRPS
ncbi:hypothetical protein FB45DRAFT_918437 [Roridomyces roridus]|uniref:Transmembrane protein n=1 Tax=Roridomyces roridus TaxID=1738132 RepID=A0AAD7FJR0_9AGAR|nr:hypothetical protein FB45DRAFT_918437 [Roridomyces roridus]